VSSVPSNTAGTSSSQRTRRRHLSGDFSDTYSAKYTGNRQSTESVDNMRGELEGLSIRIPHSGNILACRPGRNFYSIGDRDPELLNLATRVERSALGEFPCRDSGRDGVVGNADGPLSFSRSGTSLSTSSSLGGMAEKAQ
jgi:hypothetical protein